VTRVPQKAADERVTIPVVEEDVVVRKRKKITGAVRVRTVVHEDEQTVDEPVRAEEVEVERVPVDRWVDGPVPVRQEGDTTIISLVEEVVVVEKRLKVTEEIRITKRPVTGRVSDRVRVRREEAVVERLEPSSGTGHSEED
jgi:uncharacterized protein (TIGR02271 family)